jgi:hypothetical protein
VRPFRKLGELISCGFASINRRLDNQATSNSAMMSQIAALHEADRHRDARFDAVMAEIRNYHEEVRKYNERLTLARRVETKK